MGSVKQFFVGAVRWAWFGILLLLAFSYLAAGLSKSNSDASQTPDSTGSSAQRARLSSSTESSPNGELREILDRLNALRLDDLELRELPSAEAADWLTICRRMSLALVGNGLSLEEIRQLE
ncbi:MAG: hypothetical protein AAGI63_03350, partial [Planctomycetota bacterium]